MRSLSVQLRLDEPWDPAQLTKPSLQQLWGTSRSLTSLGELGSRIMPRMQENLVVVRPGDIDASGHISLNSEKRSDMSYFLAASDEGCKPGDLLISNPHTIFVSAVHSSLAFSSRFLGFRPNIEVDAAWVWACLNSNTGRRALRSLSTSTSSFFRPLRLAEILVPEPDETWTKKRKQIEQIIQSLSKSFSPRDVGQSWWRMTELQGEGNWSSELAARDPRLLHEGRLLGDDLIEVRSGRKPSVIEAEKFPGSLPVVGADQIKGKPSKGFASESSGVIANPGDILVQRTGVKGPAFVCLEECLADSTLLVLTPGPGVIPNEIAAFFNSAAGQRQRALYAAGSFIPSLSISGVKSIHWSPVESEVSQGPTETLGALLDRILWT